MIPIHDLATGEELVGGQIPNPRGTIAQDHRLGGVHPVPLTRFSPHHLAKDGRTTQVCDIGIVNRVRQRHEFPRVRVPRGLHRDLKDTADFQFFPAFLTQMDHPAIHRGA